MVILQDSGRKMVILQDSGRKMVILQVSGRMNGYLARFWQKSCKIMHNLARFWQNLPESCKITIRNRLGFKHIFKQNCPMLSTKSYLVNITQFLIALRRLRQIGSRCKIEIFRSSLFQAVKYGSL